MTSEALKRRLRNVHNVEPREGAAETIVIHRLDGIYVADDDFVGIECSQPECRTLTIRMSWPEDTAAVVASRIVQFVRRYDPVPCHAHRKD